MLRIGTTEEYLAQKAYSFDGNQTDTISGEQLGRGIS